MSKRVSLALILSAVFTLTCAYAQDNWKGGTGNWSNGSDWSAGLPDPGSDVVIYSGGNDTVTLDTSPTINSLTLGGASNGSTSNLTDGGVAQTLTITNGLTVGQTDLLTLTGASSMAAMGSLTNSGLVDVENGSTLQVNGGVSNSGDLYTDRGDLGGGNTLNVKGGLTNSASGSIFLLRESALTVTGDVNNSGTICAGCEDFGFFGSGSNTVTINGALTNKATFWIDAGTATIGSVDNSGSIRVSYGSEFTVKGDVNNSSFICTGCGYYQPSGLNTLMIAGTLTNTSTGKLEMDGIGYPDTARIGSVDNSGSIYVFGGSNAHS